MQATKIGPFNIVVGYVAPSAEIPELKTGIMNLMQSSYNIASLIRKKRDRETLKEDELRYIIRAYSRDEIPDYQMSAFLMAVFLNGMSDEETAILTEEMLCSGEVVDLSSIPGTKVDKHSTGGVGDKTSLILAPMVAACGVPVPMISGRGLGHSGGTLDKLESIPGFSVNLDLNQYKQVLKKHNVVLIGQTEEIAPADKRMYALRDVTATVESIPLITGSIMSKKLAEGIDALVLDVKYGKGAFMKEASRAMELAKRLISVGESFGKQTVAYLTSMEEPLGNYIGNWHEVFESIQALQGEGPQDLMEVTELLAGTMIFLGGKADSVEAGIEQARESIRDGRAMQKFLDIVEEQGGDTEVIRNPETYPEASVQWDVTAQDEGYIHTLDAYSLGVAAVELGAGRMRKEDTIDPQAGLVLQKKIGAYVQKGETIVRCFSNNKQATDNADKKIRQAIEIKASEPEKTTLISHKITKEGVVSL
ncbi:thymidine phosphorylase [Balneolaceae bacterium ANBcel3]|nr:thymidine phosphorylase [Balneolaceae bacterium ANBcel3]